MDSPAAESSTTLFTHKFSPFALCVQIAMVEKDIPFNAVTVDLRNKPKELLEANPLHGTVPSLVHNGSNVLESLIILEYLDDAFPKTFPLLPKDPVERARCRFWANYIHKTCKEEFIPAMLAAPGSPKRHAGVEKYAKYVRTLEGGISGFSEAGPFFCGEKFGYLDCVMAPFVAWNVLFAKLGLNIPDDVPRLSKCIKAISDHKSVKEIIPTGEEVLEYWVVILGAGLT